MKQLATVLFASLTTAAFAGQPVIESSKKTVIPEEPCFGETELQLDVYGAGAFVTHNSDEDGWGGGLGLNYYFSRYIGVGVDGTVTSQDDGVWQFHGHLLARWPIDTGSLCLAPYLKVGGGWQVDGSDDWAWGGGAGIEFRVTPTVGIFTEGAYYWGVNDSAVDYTQVKAGVRFIF